MPGLLPFFTSSGLVPLQPCSGLSLDAAAYALSHTVGTPFQGRGRTVNFGAYAGAGANVFVTNAGSVQQLGGPFKTVSLNVGVGPIKASLQFSYANGIWEASIGPPYVGQSLGASFSALTTTTKTAGGVCH